MTRRGTAGAAGHGKGMAGLGGPGWARLGKARLTSRAVSFRRGGPTVRINRLQAVDIADKEGVGIPAKGWRKHPVAETSTEPSCSSETGKHVWLILPPAGPVSQGRCRDCLEEREFLNSQPSDYGGSWRVTRNSGLGSLSGKLPRETTT